MDFNIFSRVPYHRLYSRVEPITDIDIETTTYCNRRCSYCPNSIFERSLRKNERLMSPALFRKIIDELVDMGFNGRINPLRYGEPLTDSRLISFMHYARERLPQATLKIYTNGDFLTAILLDQLYDAGVRDYLVTLHSTDEPSLTASINRMRQLKEHIKVTQKNINFAYQTYLEMPLVNRGGLVVVDERKRPGWSCTDSALNITYSGDVLLCCDDYLGVTAFGNVQNESLIDIWSKPEFVRIRQELRRNVYSFDICKKCTQRKPSQTYFKRLAARVLPQNETRR